MYFMHEMSQYSGLTPTLVTYTLSGWPDLIVGLGIAAMNADATREVWNAAREEHRVANS